MKIEITTREYEIINSALVSFSNNCSMDLSTKMFYTNDEVEASHQGQFIIEVDELINKLHQDKLDNEAEDLK